MNIEEQVLLGPHTTLGVGGSAQFFVEASNEDAIKEVIAFARTKHLPMRVLGGGSNVLVPDSGMPGIVVRITANDIRLHEDAEYAYIEADAGARWDDVVDRACAGEVFGIENLAGIPGTVGGALVQNIGAYGAELSEVFSYADVIEKTTGEQQRIDASHAQFSYRTSFFKEHPEYVIVRAGLRLSKQAVPNLAYTDLAHAQAQGVPLSNPRQIAAAVRAIRAQKFPLEGSAGSFFKNPLLPVEVAKALQERYPGLPVFSQNEGLVKVSLAWILDHVLHLKGYTDGFVRLYEHQPLVIVASKGATASQIDAFARTIAERVHEMIGITIEREVETFYSKEINNVT